MYPYENETLLGSETRLTCTALRPQDVIVCLVLKSRIQPVNENLSRLRGQ